MRPRHPCLSMPPELQYICRLILYIELKGAVFMKIIFKILSAPFVVILTLVVAFMQFLFHISGWVFGLVSGLLGIIGVVTLFTGTIFNGVALLVIAFLVSPYGIPMLAVHLTVGLQSINYALRDFIMG